MLSTLNCISILHCLVAFGLLQETQHSEGEDAREDVDLWQVKKKKKNKNNTPTPKQTKKPANPKLKTKNKQNKKKPPPTTKKKFP